VILILGGLHERHVVNLFLLFNEINPICSDYTKSEYESYETHKYTN
jgi:hypothetical protein